MTGKLPFKTFVLAGLAGVGMFLCMRYLQMGRLKSLDWVIAGVGLGLGLLVLWVSFRRVATRAAADESQPVDGRRRWLLGIGVTLLLFVMTYDILTDFAAAFAQRSERLRAARAEDSPGRDMQIVRRLAGRPDSTGWIPASSAAGGFFVYVPSRFNEAIGTMDEAGRPVSCVAVAARGGDLKLVAIALKSGDAGQDPRGRLTDARRRLDRFKDAVVCKEGLFEDKFPFVELEVNTAKSKGLAQIIVTDEAVYSLCVEGPTWTEALRNTAERFFDSFTILPARAEGTMVRDPRDNGEPNQ